MKLIAVLCMITDHVGALFFPQIREMRLIGRVAFPLFAWCAVVGCCHTRNIWLYALRLILAGVIAQPFYYQLWGEWNVCFPLALGVLAIAGIRCRRFGSHVWAPALAVLAACAVKMDGDWRGIALILVLYGCRKSRPALAAGMTAFCLFWAHGTFTVTSLFGIPLAPELPGLPFSRSLIQTVTQAQFFAILALPLILLPLHRKPRCPKWVFYAVYPGHLFLLAWIQSGRDLIGYITRFFS